MISQDYFAEDKQDVSCRWAFTTI